MIQWTVAKFEATMSKIRVTGDSPVFLSPKKSMAYCPVQEANGTSLTSNDEDP